MQDKKTPNNPQPTAQTPSAAEKEAFIALFAQFYGSGGPFSRWGSDLRVLREADDPRALAASHNGLHTIKAMRKVRNAEAEAKSLSGQVQLDTPAEGDCLFWAVMLGALIRANGTADFEAVVSRLFGEEPAAVDAKQLSEVLLPSYQGRVSDITAYSTTHAFHALMMRFRGRVANHIKKTSALHGSIAGDATTYTDQMSEAGTWGGEVEIKAMAALLGMDIIVHRGAGSPMHRMPAVAGEATAEALHIAHVPASARASVRNHYRFYVPEAKITWSREVSAVEKAARDAYAEYQTWRFFSYPEMTFLGTLLQSRLPSQPRDTSFDQQILSLLVTGHRNPLAEGNSTSFQTVAGMFMDKYYRGDQGFFGSSTGPYAQFPESLRRLFGGLADQVDPYAPRPLLNMDINSMSNMLSFLTLKDQVALVLTTQRLYCQQIGRKLRVNRLLSLVAQGRQAEAEVMIKKDPSLLLARGDVTDGAGRTFRHITALQYAVWAMDAHMWTMMLPYIDQINAGGSASEQLRQLEEEGTAHGRHFDFKPLLDAYAAYFASPSVESWCFGVVGAQRLLPENVMQEYTTPVGAQRLLPENVMQEYTTPDRPFHPVPDFSVQRGRPRALQVGAGISARECNAAFNQAALNALWSQRRQDLSDLLTRFDILPSHSPESKLPGR